MFALSLAVVATATWVGVSYAHRSPINWIGISACAVGFLFYATRQTLPADVLGSIEHLPAVRRIMLWARWARRGLKFEEDRLFGPHPSPTPKEASRHVEDQAS